MTSSTEKREVTEEGLKQGISSLFAAFEADHQKELELKKDELSSSNPGLAEAIAYYFEHDPERIDSQVLSQINDYVESLIPEGGDKFLYMNSIYIEGHFNTAFETFEGMACCSDKSITMLRMLFKFAKTGQDIKLNYDQEYTFHLPKIILKTHQEIADFYDAIKSMYYGNPGKYFKCYESMANKHSEYCREKNKESEPAKAQ